MCVWGCMSLFLYVCSSVGPCFYTFYIFFSICFNIFSVFLTLPVGRMDVQPQRGLGWAPQAVSPIRDGAQGDVTLPRVLLGWVHLWV